MAVLKIYQASDRLPIRPKWKHLQREGFHRHLSIEVRIHWRAEALLRKIDMNQVTFFPTCVFPRAWTGATVPIPRPE